jgi:hypothetical protein
VLLLLAVCASTGLAGTTVWIGRFSASSSWFEPENWSNGVPNDSIDAVVAGTTGYVVRVEGAARCRSLTVSAPVGAQSFYASTFATKGSLTIGAGGLIYNAANNSFLSMSLDLNSMLTVNGPLRTSISPGSADASFLVLANASGASCYFESMDLNGGSALSMGGQLSRCTIRQSITTNGRVVRLDSRYVPEPAQGAVFDFFGSVGPYLTGNRFINGAWRVGPGGLELDSATLGAGSSFAAPLNPGGAIFINNVLTLLDGAQTVRNRVVFEAGSSVSLGPNSLRLLEGAETIDTLVVSGSGGFALGGSSILGGSIVRSVLELVAPSSISVTSSISLPESFTSGSGQVSFSGVGLVTFENNGVRSRVTAVAGTTLSLDRALAGDATVQGKLAIVREGTFFTVNVANWASLSVPTGRIVANSIVIGGARSLLQIGVSSFSQNPVSVVSSFQSASASEINLIPSSSFAWNSSALINLITLASETGSGSFFLSGEPRDAAVYSLVYTPSSGPWRTVSVQRTPGSPPPPIVCGENVCGLGANCRNCPACGSDPNGNTWCCDGSSAASFCFFQKDPGICAANMCPLGPPKTTTAVGTTRVGTTGTAAQTTAPAVSTTTGATTGGAITTVPVGGTTTVPVGGTTTVPVGGTTTVPVGGTTTVPVGGTTTVPVGGTTTVPVGGTTTVPVGGTTTVPVGGTTTRSSTTAPVTSASTSAASTTGAQVTTRLATTVPITLSTSALATTAQVTTAQVTTAQVTTAQVGTTTGPVTTRAATTAPATSSPVATTVPVTTTGGSGTTGAGTTGRAGTTRAGTTGPTGTTAPATVSPTVPPLNPNDIPNLPNEYPFSMPLFGGEGTLFWRNLVSNTRQNQQTGVWSVAMVFPMTRGYFGLGLPTRLGISQGHLESDMILVTIDEARNVVLSDRWSTANALPDLDTALGGRDNLLLPQGIITPAGQLYIKFRRLFVTGDRFDVNVNVTSTQRCSFAFNRDSTVLNHGRANRETQTCNFGNVTIPTPPPLPPLNYALIVAHAVLGAFGVGLFLTFGGFFYRYLWCLSIGARMWISNILFLLGGVLVIISFIIAGVMVAQRGAPHFSFDSASQGAHSILSLVVMIAVVAFLLTRFLADCALKPSRIAAAEVAESEKAQFYRLASFGGWAMLVISVLVGWPAIFLGFVDFRETFPWLWVIGGILIGVGVIFIVAEVIRCIAGPKPVQHDKDEVEMSDMAAR